MLRLDNLKEAVFLVLKYSSNTERARFHCVDTVGHGLHFLIDYKFYNDIRGTFV